jgi:6-phosphogluconate dehydrogenase
MSNSSDKFDFGMIGLGTMGRNLLLNMGDHGVSGAGLVDRDKTKGQLLEEEGKDMKVKIKAFDDIKVFTENLKSPKKIMMLVPAGPAVDSVIARLLPLLDKGDILIDGGNSHFTDTNRRVEELEAKGFHFFGMGVSGGEEGARRGPSMMPGGDKDAYDIMAPIFEAIAAHVDGEPCVTYIGPGASGHFVKMVHNGIEYGIMQLIAETYEIMKTGLGMDNAAIEKVFVKWNNGRLSSFLIDITKDIFAYKAPGTDHLLLDDIKDEAKAKGTGKWTSQVAMDLQAPIPTIDEAVSMRDLSKYKDMRVQAAGLYSKEVPKLNANTDEFLIALEEALYFSMIISYAQGMFLLSRASEEYKYELQLDQIAKIWRGGCIIRSEFLNDIFNAYKKDPKLAHLLLDAGVQNIVSGALPGTRKVITSAMAAGIAVPAFAASLTYFDNFRTARMPSNLTQAQRDYFGAHTYELIGKEGTFHTQWVEPATN